MTDRAIINFSSEVILVADHTKFGKVSTALVAPITAMHTLVTDSAARSDIVASLKELGIEVILA
jgi:DeoR/GlpR family transcriptional regulator of sugar metabolism